MMFTRRRKRLIRRTVQIAILIWAAVLILCISLNASNFMDVMKQTWHQLKYGTHGYIRAEGLHRLCNMRGSKYKTGYLYVQAKYSTTNDELQLLPVWKAGTTFLKRLFMMKTMKTFENVTNPYNISFLEEITTTKGFLSENSTKFVFVRNPYDRLISGYVDKLLAPNPVYWKVIGIPAIRYGRPNPSEKSLKCGHDLTFEEYVKYVIFILGSTNPVENRRRRRRKGVHHDGHFATLTEISNPCIIKYDFVGKMETFTADSLELIRQLNLSKTERILKSSGREMAADDAIQDTTYQPFDFRSQFVKCITIREALERSWKKLQIRGLIGEQELHIEENEAEKLTYVEFLHKARTARRISRKENRAKLKTAYFDKFYATIPDEMLQKLSLVYSDDFKLFDYDSKPNNLFNRASVTHA